MNKYLIRKHRIGHSCVVLFSVFVVLVMATPLAAIQSNASTGLAAQHYRQPRIDTYWVPSNNLPNATEAKGVTPACLTTTYYCADFFPNVENTADASSATSSGGGKGSAACVGQSESPCFSVQMEWETSSYDSEQISLGVDYSSVLAEYCYNAGSGTVCTGFGSYPSMESDWISNNSYYSDLITIQCTASLDCSVDIGYPTLGTNYNASYNIGSGLGSLSTPVEQATVGNGGDSKATFTNVEWTNDQWYGGSGSITLGRDSYGISTWGSTSPITGESSTDLAISQDGDLSGGQLTDVYWTS